MRHLPLAPVRQRASDDVALLVEFPDGHVERCYYRPGAAEYLIVRYAGEIKEGVRPWKVTVAPPGENGG